MTAKSDGEPIISTLSAPGKCEHFITINSSDASEMERLAIDAATKRGAKILENFVFSGIESFKDFKGNAAPREIGMTWLQGDSCKDGMTSSLQALAISNTKVTPIHLEGRLLGFVYEDEFARYCRLCGVTPKDTGASRKEQTREVFENVDKALKSAGFKFTDTVRTWFYLDKLLTWYKDFNEVRTAYFEETGIFGKMVPASTGIGAANHSGGALICGLYAIQPKDARVKIQAVDSPLQGSALSYKSSFSRAVEMAYPSHRMLMISGTASIDKAGKSIHIGDPLKQIDMTMQVIEALLKSRDMDWQDVSRGIAYFKSMDSLPIFMDYCKVKGLPPLPLAIANTDICRDDLLFEAEIDAIKRA